MHKDKVIDAVRHIMSGPRAFEHERLEMIAEALKPWTEANAHQRLRRKGVPMAAIDGLAWISQSNFLPLVLDVYSQSMKVDNYIASSTRSTAKSWEWWQRNKMAAQQTGIIRSVLSYGVGYAVVTNSLTPEGVAQPPSKGAVIRPLTPRKLTALYADPIEWTPGVTPADNDWPQMALEINGKAIRFYDEEFVHFIGVKHVPESALGWKDPMYSSADNFEYIEARPHNVGVCPVIRFRDRWLLDGDEVMGIIEPLIQVQARIDETVYEGLVAQYFTSFTQRWVAGWKPKDSAEALRQAASDTWYFDKNDVKVGQFSQGSPDGYIAMEDNAKRDFMALGQVPAQNLGLAQLANISEATLAGLEHGKEMKSAEIQTSLGESFEQLLRTCSHVTDDVTGASDFDAEVKWQDTTARSFAQTIDALGKMKAILDVPDEMAWEDIPGWTKAKVERALKLRDEQRAEMLALAKPVPGPGEFDNGAVRADQGEPTPQQAQAQTPPAKA